MGNYYRVWDRPELKQVWTSLIKNPQTVPASDLVWLDVAPPGTKQADGITYIADYAGPVQPLAFTTDLPATPLPDQYRLNNENLPVQTVAVTGGVPPYSYQWRRGTGQNIGTNSPTLDQTVDATFPAAGNYSISCVVTDSATPTPNTITSNARAISIYALPSFTTQPPTTLSVAAGAAIRIATAASNGKAPRTYTWLKDGAPITNPDPSEGPSIFKKAAAVAGDAGSYVARATDANGKIVNSSACVVTIT